MRVEVYFNITKKIFSVRPLSGEGKGLVDKNLSGLNVCLMNTVFSVSKKGMQRVRNTGVKNVHAFVRGELVDPMYLDAEISITYNPKKYTTFVERETLNPVHQAKYIEMVVVNGYPELKILKENFQENTCTMPI